MRQISISGYAIGLNIERGRIAIDTGATLAGNALANDLLVGGAGDDTLLGGAGNDRFQYALGEGMDTIGDFAAGSASFDTIRLLGTGVTRFVDLAPLMTQVGNDVVIAFNETSHVTLQHVQLSSLNAGDFLFA